MPGGHIGTNRETVSHALTPYKVVILWQVSSNSCYNFLLKPMSTGLEIGIFTICGDAFTHVWLPYWTELKNHFTCIDTL